jgi:hypothetical protein
VVTCSFILSEDKRIFYEVMCYIYRLIHTIFHIRTVIIPRNRYLVCINLFITHFNIEFKRTKLTSHTHTHTHTHQTMSDWYRLRDDNSPDMEKGIHCSIYKEAWYHVFLFIKRLDIMLSEFCPDICPWADIAVARRCLRMSKIDVITYRYVIIID